MIKEHYLFITITAFFVALIIGLTTSGLNGATGYFIKEESKDFCEPMTCAQRGLEPAGIFYCNKDMCYRDCYQQGILIEKATFCKRV